MLDKLLYRLFFNDTRVRCSYCGRVLDEKHDCLVVDKPAWYKARARQRFDLFIFFLSFPIKMLLVIAAFSGSKTPGFIVLAFLLAFLGLCAYVRTLFYPHSFFAQHFFPYKVLFPKLYYFQAVFYGAAILGINAYLFFEVLKLL